MRYSYCRDAEKAISAGRIVPTNTLKANLPQSDCV
jgi:hypothetical protein